MPSLLQDTPSRREQSQSSGEPIAEETSTTFSEPVQSDHNGGAQLNSHLSALTATSRARTGARGSATPQEKFWCRKDPPAELKIVGGRGSDQLCQRRVLCSTGKHCVQPAPPASRRSGSLSRLPKRLSQAQSSCLFPFPCPFLPRRAKPFLHLASLSSSPGRGHPYVHISLFVQVVRKSLRLLWCGTPQQVERPRQDDDRFPQASTLTPPAEPCLEHTCVKTTALQAARQGPAEFRARGPNHQRRVRLASELQALELCSPKPTAFQRRGRCCRHLVTRVGLADGTLQESGERCSESSSHVAFGSGARATLRSKRHAGVDVSRRRQMGSFGDDTHRSPGNLPNSKPGLQERCTAYGSSQLARRCVGSSTIILQCLQPGGQFARGRNQRLQNRVDGKGRRRWM